MKRSGPLRRITPLRAARRKRQTGFPRAVIAQAIDRDRHCVMCGLVSDPRDLTGHHRINRGSGGSTDPEINGIRNCLALCWPCNGVIESSADRAREARVRGIKLAGWQSLDTPVYYPSGYPYWLDEHGQRRQVDGAA